MPALIGFSPDLDPDAVGGINLCENIIPSDRGMKPCPTPITTGTNALAAACRGIVNVLRTDGARRTIAGTTTDLYDLSAGAWISRYTGATLGSEERWSFAQFGNITLAATPSVNLLTSSSTTFSAIGGGVTVKAKYIITVNGFVMAANYNNGTDTLNDGWKCSAYQNYADWVEAPATQCASGRILDNAGEITGLKALGEYAVIYQADSVHLGIYVGAPAVWGFRKIPGEIGCKANGLIVANEQFHLFFGQDDVYRFDGSNCIALQAPCSRWVIDRMNQNALHLCETAWDQERGLAWWFYPADSDTNCDSYVCYHPETGKWGYGLLDIEAVVQYATEGYTYITIPSAWTYDSMPEYSYESSFWGSGKITLSIVDLTHTIYTVNGGGQDASMTLADMGSDQGYSLLSRMFPRFFTQPTTATATISAKYDADDSFVTATTSTLDRGKFDFLSSAMWHKVKIDLTGDWELQGFDVDLKADGSP